MKIPLFLQVFLLCITFAIPIISQEESEYDGYIEDAVITEISNVRERPSLQNSVLTVLMPGEEVWIIDEKPVNGYFRILFVNSKQGYVYYKNIEINKELFEKNKKEKSFFTCPVVRSLSECLPSGCYDPASKEALLNIAKNHIPTDTKSTFLTFADFQRLQDEADTRLGRRSFRVVLTKEQRLKLRNINVSGKIVGEGSLVTLVGFIPIKRSEYESGLKKGSIETVNCNLTEDYQRDIHIPLTSTPNEIEFRGIVIEMIPHKRHSQWNLTKLKTIQERQKMVMISGGLFFDSVHIVNKDPLFPIKTGHSKRFSVWEIHPVTQFLVCKKANNACNPARRSDWIPLESYN